MTQQPTVFAIDSHFAAGTLPGTAGVNLQPLIVESIRRSAINVFETMLGAELGAGEASIEHDKSDAGDGVVSFIGIAGVWAGTGVIVCSPELACRLCNLMLMTENSSVNEEVLDAVAELTNMIIGCVKTDIEEEVGPLGLSIPTVVFGKNFRTKNAAATDWITIRFPWEGEIFLVKMCLAPH